MDNLIPTDLLTNTPSEDLPLSKESNPSVMMVMNTWVQEGWMDFFHTCYLPPACLTLIDDLYSWLTRPLHLLTLCIILQTSHSFEMFFSITVIIEDI